MAIDEAADPNVGPSRRNYERFDSFNDAGIAHASAPCCEIANAVTVAMALEAWFLVSHVTETSQLGELFWSNRKRFKNLSTHVMETSNARPKLWTGFARPRGGDPRRIRGAFGRDLLCRARAELPMGGTSPSTRQRLRS